MTAEQKAEEYAGSEEDKIDIIRTVKDWHLRKNAFLAGYHECQKEHEWHYDEVPEITHKTCIALIDRLPNVILVFWNGEVWIDTRTLERRMTVKAWKYVDFPQEK